MNPESATPPRKVPRRTSPVRMWKVAGAQCRAQGKGPLYIHGWPWSFWCHVTQGALPGVPSCEAEDANP